MLINRPIVTSRLFTSSPKTPRTIEEELKDPKSPLSIDMNNALMNRDNLLRRLRIQEFQYVSFLKEQEKAEEEEQEIIENRRQAQQDALLRQSLEEYYKEQYKLAEQACAYGEKPLSAYDQLMTAVADHQMQLNIITKELHVVREQAKQAETSYCQASMDWKKAEQIYVDAYFDAAYQTPISLKEQPFTLDLNSSYGAHLSLQQRKQLKEHREEAKQSAQALLPPLEVLNELQQLDNSHPALQQPDRGKVASAMSGYKREIHELAPLITELNLWLETHQPINQGRLRAAICEEHRSIINFAKALMKKSHSSQTVKSASLEMRKAEGEMVLAQTMMEELTRKELGLEMLQTQKRQHIEEVLGAAGNNLFQRPGQRQKAMLIYQVLETTKEKNEKDRAVRDELDTTSHKSMSLSPSAAFGA